MVQPVRPEALALLEARQDIAHEVVTDFSQANLLRHVAAVEALIIRDAPLPAAVLEAAPLLKVVSRHGVGYDNIPIDYCTRRGLPVTVVGDVNAASVAEHALFLMLAVAKWGVRLDRAVRAGDFAARGRLTAVELRGRVLLVVGFGWVGREVARRAAAFGMEVIVYDPLAERGRDPGVRFADDLEEALAEAQVVTLHLPLGPDTRHLIGARELAAMRAGAILVNTARGGIVDEAALIAALDRGHLLGAGLDTFETEPLPTSHPLARRDDVVLSPHSAALTDEALVAMGVAAVRNALAGIDGSLAPRLVVNRSVLGTTPGVP